MDSSLHTTSSLLIALSMDPSLLITPWVESGGIHSPGQPSCSTLCSRTCLWILLCSSHCLWIHLCLSRHHGFIFAYNIIFAYHTVYGFIFAHHTVCNFLIFHSLRSHYRTFVGLAEPYIHTVCDRMYGDFPAKNTVYTPYMTVCMVISLPKILYTHRI